MYAKYLQASWWVWLVAGVVGVLMGLLFLNYPGLTFAVITVFFGIFALVTGLVYVIGALANRKEMDGFWSTLLFEGYFHTNKWFTHDFNASRNIGHSVSSHSKNLTIIIKIQVWCAIHVFEI